MNEGDKIKSKLSTSKAIKATALILLFLLMNITVVKAPKAYTYSSFAYNSLVLHCIKTSPDNIEFVSLEQAENLEASPYYGINGGYFPIGLGNKAFSIAVEKKDGAVLPVIDYSANAGYSDGRCNLSDNGAIAPRGTLVWSGTEFSCQYAYFYTELKDVQWAQGGVSMLLGSPCWYFQAAIREDLPVANGAVMRTAMVGINSDEKSVLLIASDNPCSARSFREAIERMLNITDTGKSSTYFGIFLDGGPSTQFKAVANNGDEISVTTSTRLVQIVALKDSN